MGSGKNVAGGLNDRASIPAASFASDLTRLNAVGKPRRVVGDPVAVLKQNTRFLPVPEAPPALLKVPFSLFDPAASAAATSAGRLVFHCVGDTGGIHGTATEEAVAEGMEAQITAAVAGNAASFCFNLGDVIYFNGQSTLYKSEFYEPYQYYPKLIFAIPGNHDGDTFVEKGDAPDTEPSLYGFMQNFCAQQAVTVTPYRMTMTQPYCYWTLDAPFVTIIGLYSNVEGSLDARGRMDQQHFLNTQMQAADPTKKLIVAVHHPPYSLDSVHGGTPDILNALDQAVAASGRTPDAVLSGHVHNYQRFSRVVGTRTIPYVVAGAGGYANDVGSLHKLQPELTTPPVALPYATTVAGVSLENYEQTMAGFLRITATTAQLTFEYFRVPFGGVVEATAFDTFTA
ncbi:MAG TPA: metallophosphoesterase [Acidobacteriaceae bacterium]|nr:metallophosphoesterase [Acidobacteriaceae bacterium]